MGQCGASIGAAMWVQHWAVFGGSVKGGSTLAVLGQYRGTIGAVLWAELGQYWGCALAVFGGILGPVLGQYHASAGVHPGCTGAVPWQ